MRNMGEVIIKRKFLCSRRAIEMRSASQCVENDVVYWMKLRLSSISDRHQWTDGQSTDVHGWAMAQGTRALARTTAFFGRLIDDIFAKIAQWLRADERGKSVKNVAQRKWSSCRIADIFDMGTKLSAYRQISVPCASEQLPNCLRHVCFASDATENQNPWRKLDFERN